MYLTFLVYLCLCAWAEGVCRTRLAVVAATTAASSKRVATSAAPPGTRAGSFAATSKCSVSTVCKAR
jgi:hypothetical protein